MSTDDFVPTAELRYALCIRKRFDRFDGWYSTTIRVLQQRWQKETSLGSGTFVTEYEWRDVPTVDLQKEQSP